MASDPAQRPTPGEPGHLGFLDGVRGLAALWVVIGHSMIFGGWYWAKFPEPVIAVDVFMFVSGFLMVHQWTRRVGPGDHWDSAAAREFWVRRFFRIVPVYYLCLAVMFVYWNGFEQGLSALRAANPGRWEGLTAYDPETWDSGIRNALLRFTFLFGLLPSHAVTSFTGDWSLSLEMQFYAAFPWLVMALRRWGAGAVVWTAIGIALLLKESALRLQGYFPGIQLIFPLPSFLLLKLPVFLVGMILAEVARRFTTEPVRCAYETVLALFAAALTSWYVVTVAALTFFLVTGGSGISAGAAKWRGRLSVFLGNRLMTALADASYAVYLFHSLVIPLAGGWLLQQAWFAAMPGRSRVIVLLGVVLAITYPLAWALHFLVEKPGIEWGRRWAKRCR